MQKISLPKSSFYSMLDVLLIVIVVLFAFYRSVKLDITNDEAFSFLNIDMLNTHMMYGTANTHWLNSFFMFIWDHLLGYEPWKLRIHSVLALGIFAFFILKIFRQITSSWLLLIPVTLLLLNPYLIDYFSLARGYALSIAFETVAFYYIIQQKKEYTTTIYFFLSVATLSNYTCIYFLFCYFLLELIDIVRRSDLKQQNRK